MKNISAKIIDYGIMDCFPQGLTDSKGQPVYAETSAVVYYDNSLIVASDKDIPGYSSVFSIGYPILKGENMVKELKYFTEEILRESKKLRILWTISLHNFEKNMLPQLLKQNDGNPLTFWNKPEGVAVIDKETVFIICDDDRILESSDLRHKLKYNRNPNQAAYITIRLRN